MAFFQSLGIDWVFTIHWTSSKNLYFNIASIPPCIFMAFVTSVPLIFFFLNTNIYRFISLPFFNVLWLLLYKFPWVFLPIPPHQIGWAHSTSLCLNVVRGQRRLISSLAVPVPCILRVLNSSSPLESLEGMAFPTSFGVEWRWSPVIQKIDVWDNVPQGSRSLYCNCFDFIVFIFLIMRQARLKNQCHVGQDYFIVTAVVAEFWSLNCVPPPTPKITYWCVNWRGFI